MVEHFKNYYEILGLTPGASLEDIRKAYIQLAKQYHPDHNINTVDDRHMIELNQIYEILSNPIKKQEYDARFKLEKTHDFTKSNSNSAVSKQQAKRVSKTKFTSYQHLRKVLMIFLWLCLSYLVIYFLVNIITTLITLPDWLLSWFPM